MKRLAISLLLAIAGAVVAGSAQERFRRQPQHLAQRPAPVGQAEAVVEVRRARLHPRAGAQPAPAR